MPRNKYGDIIDRLDETFADFWCVKVSWVSKLPSSIKDIWIIHRYWRLGIFYYSRKLNYYI